MKKLVMAGVALAMTSGISGAYAMGNAEITLSGSIKWTYKDHSTDADATDEQANDTSAAVSASTTIASSASSDSGLTYGTSFTLNSGGGDVIDDGIKLYVKGAHGEIRTGSSGAGDTYGIGADGAVEGESNGTKKIDSSVAQAGDTSISYFTPELGGLSAGLTYTDAGADSKADSTEYGVSYKTDVGGNSLKLTASIASVDAGADDEKIDTSSYGATYTSGDFGLRVAVNNYEQDTTDRDSLGFGLSYTASKDLKFGLYSASGEEDAAGTKTDFDELGASLTYTIAPGLTTNFAYTDYEEGDGSGSNVDVYLKVAF